MGTFINNTGGALSSVSHRTKNKKSKKKQISINTFLAADNTSKLDKAQS